ncbi:unnamed protein product [Pylaiella littoralis]
MIKARRSSWQKSCARELLKTVVYLKDKSFSSLADMLLPGTRHTSHGVVRALVCFLVLAGELLRPPPEI